MWKSIVMVIVAEIILLGLVWIGYRAYLGKPILGATEKVEIVSATPDTLKLEATADSVKTDVTAEVPTKTVVSTPIEGTK